MSTKQFTTTGHGASNHSPLPFNGRGKGVSLRPPLNGTDQEWREYIQGLSDTGSMVHYKSLEGD